MRALLLFSNVVFLGLVYSLTSLSGLLIMMAVCFGFAALMFATSTSDKEAGESRPMRRALGGHSTWMGPATQF